MTVLPKTKFWRSFLRNNWVWKFRWIWQWVKQQSEKLGLDTVEGWSESPIVASAPTDGNSLLCEDLIVKVMKLGYKSYIRCNTTKPETTTLVEYQVRQRLCYFLTCQNFQKILFWKKNNLWKKIKQFLKYLGILYYVFKWKFKN